MSYKSNHVLGAFYPFKEKWHYEEEKRRKNALPPQRQSKINEFTVKVARLSLVRRLIKHFFRIIRYHQTGMLHIHTQTSLITRLRHYPLVALHPREEERNEARTQRNPVKLH